MAKEYKNHLEYMNYLERKRIKEEQNKDFAQKIVLIVEIEEIERKLNQEFILNEVTKKIKEEKDGIGEVQENI